MKKLLFAALILGLFSTSQAQLMGGPGAPALQKGDIIVGGKLALGSVYGANMGFIANGEYGFKEGFLAPPKFNTSLGIGVSIGYSGYNDVFGDYSDFLILGAAYWHINLIKKEQFDTYVVVRAGIDINTTPSDTYFDPAGGASVGIRYYFTPKLAAVAETGYGMGIVRVGLDFKL
jgi:hypothetical protein